MIAGLNRGDLVDITWVDIFEDSVGDPDKAELARRHSVGSVWGEATSFGVECLVTTTTLDERDHAQSGFCIYPKGCVVGVKVLKRKRQRRPKKGVVA
jgi:hypothetical protein